MHDRTDGMTDAVFNRPGGPKPHYDFVVCGAGSSGSVVARRLAENPDASVLLLEAGDHDEDPAVADPGRWLSNLGGPRDWGFRTAPSPHVNGRSLAWSMGKGLGGGSSVNAMIWSRGHRADWDHYAAETGDPGWGYEAVLAVYRRIEDWHGEPDARRRGTGGPVFVQPAPDPSPLVPAMLEAARSAGVPTFADPNGAMMEGPGGAALVNLRVRDGRRLSVFGTYVRPVLSRPNLDVATDALVTRVVFDGQRAVAVEAVIDGRVVRVGAGREVVLSLGAVHTPKVLLQSGVGEAAELRRFGIPVVADLPGVGRNLQDHVLVGGCLWEHATPLPPRNNAGEATLFWKSDPALDAPDLQAILAEVPVVSPELTHYAVPAASWGLLPGLVRPHSRGRLRLTGPDPADPLDIDAGFLADPADIRALVACVELCRAVGNAPALRPFARREVMPGDLRGAGLERFVRDAALTFWHQTCTAKMGRDALSVVDGELKVYGVDGLRVADGSVFPRVPTGNTMAPCVVVGERAGELIRRDHGL